MNLRKRPMGQTRRLLALLFLLLPGLNLTTTAQTWPPNAPTHTDFSIAAGNVYSPEWVNCDMHTYYDGTDPYFLIAVAWDDVNTNTVYVALYDNKTGITITMDIPNARHPDVVIADFSQCAGPIPNATQTLGIIYEDIGANTIAGGGYPITGVGTTSLAFTTYTGGLICGGPISVTGSKNPHIDLFPANLLPDGTANMSGLYVITYEVNNGNSDEIRAILHHLNQPLAGSPTGSNYADVFIDYGIRPDVAAVIVPFSATKSYFTYYKDDFSEIKGAELDLSNFNWTLPWVLPVTTFPFMETNTFMGYPRIEAGNLQGTSSTPWHAVAEVAGEGGLGSGIHGYNNTGSINVVDYSHSLGYDEFSPTVAVGNGAATYGNPADVGNAGYAVGWNIDHHELNALYLDENNTNNIVSGYDQVNTTGLGVANYGSGKNLFAMTSSSNSGIGLAAAWWDGSEIYVKLSGNSFAFKPTTIKLTNRNEVSIHPNPATDKLYVSGVKAASYTITSVTGSTLAQGDITASTALDISHLPQGIYLLNIMENGVPKHIKFAKE